MRNLTRITLDPTVMGGKPCIRGTRVTVGTLVGLVASGKTIEGVRFVILNREQLDSVRLGLELAYALEKLYPGKIDFQACRFLIGNADAIQALKAGVEPRAIEDRIADQVRKFEERRRPHLLY